MKYLCLISAVLFCCSPFVTAQTQEFPEDSGNAFVRLCSATEKESRTDEEAANAMACLGYVSGFAEGIGIYRSSAEAKTKQKMPKYFCRPDGVERGQLVSVVLKFIRNHPEDAHRRTGVLIIVALEHAFPCTK